MIYLDHNATTPLAKEALEAMLPFLGDEYANPSSAHSAGMAIKQAVSKARGQVAALVGAKSTEVIFTGSATEATHMAVLGALRALAVSAPRRRRIVTSAVEHPSTMALMADLKSLGWDVVIVPVGTDGRVAPVDIDAAVDDHTALVSLMWANNETGVLQPVREAAATARKLGALFHTDAVQAAGKVPVSLAACGADMITLSAHKMYGPKGVGALIVAKGAPISPLIFGHQERKRRGGTENVPGVVGFGVAAELAAAALAAGDAARLGGLRDRFEAAVVAAWPGSRINGAGTERVPTTSSIRFATASGAPANGEELMMRLDKAGVMVSMGAACSAGGNEPSHVLTAMGLNGAEAEASLRFSLGRPTTDAEIDGALDALSALVERLHAAA